MKLGCIITNRRVKLRVWLGNAPHHPWLINSKVNHQLVRLCLHFFGICKVRFWFISLQRVKPLTVRITVMYHGWLKAQPKYFFFWRYQKTCEKLEPALWSQGGLRWKVIIVSFLYTYNKCVFWKVPLLFDLPSYILIGKTNYWGEE
jgi:hypothetical protein